MSTIKSEMPPLHAAETTATSLSSLGSGGVSSGGVGGAGTNGSSTNSGNSTANSTTMSSASGGSSAATVNNTISAAADSSDNQPGTPQPQTQQIGVNEQQQSQTATSSGASHHAFGAHNMYATTSTTSAGALPHMFTGGIYATSANGNNGVGVVGGAHDIQQQQQQQQQQGYPSYLNSYEQFYQQQGQTQSSGNQGAGILDYGNAATLYGSSNSTDYKPNTASETVRYHPYLQTPTSNGVAGGNNGGNNDGHNATSVSVGNNVNNSAVSTTTAMSPRVVSSSSPTSTSSQLHLGSGNGSSGGNPQSPSCGQQLLCKKCGIMCTNETELQEHITNVHGASPYGSSGYSSSPYIKEEITGAPPSQPQQQQSGGNPGELLDLDSQKMVYPPIPGSMQSIMGGHSGLHHQQHHAMHDSIVSDPLHSMHSMQQRALPGWDQTPSIVGQEGLPGYMQPTDISATKPNQSPYYSPKQSPFGGGGVANIKHEYPLIKSEYADSNYVDKSFDPTVTAAPDMCQQQQQQSANTQQSMLPVSSSPAEFPSTTTGPTQEQQQQFRGFEPPTSSSVLPANNITTKAATWKSNEARRPKTYNCTACNKWFTSSGHLKRHYNTTLHKNAVKTSGLPDPATLPISVHHHPARDPTGKQSRRGNAAAAAAAAAAQQQKAPAPVQPPEPPRTPPEYATQAGVVGSGGSGLGPMSHYSTSPSPTNGGMPFGQQNGYQPTPQSQQAQSYLSQVQSSTTVSPQHVSNASSAPQSQAQPQNHSGNILNGHPNGVAGPSTHIIATEATTTLLMPSSHTRDLLNKTTTTTTIKREVNAEEDIINSNSTISNNSSRSSSSNNTSLVMDLEMTRKEIREVARLTSDEVAEMEVLELQQHHQFLVKQELQDLEPGYQQQLDQHHQLHPYHSNTPNNRAQSPLIISHQQYQEQLQLQQHQMVADNIFSQQQHQVHMLPQPPLPLQANTMEAYNIIPLDINTQQQHNSSMQLLPLSQRITNTRMATTANMLDSIPTLQQQQQQHSLLRHLQQPEERLLQEQGHNSLNITTTISNMQATPQRINTTITPQLPHMHTPLPQLQPSITNPIIPSFQALPPPEAPPQLEPTMTYHTIIGNNPNGGNGGSNNGSDSETLSNSSDLLQLSSYDPYGNNSMFTTSDGQILQFIPNNSSSLMSSTYFNSFPITASVAESYVRSYSLTATQHSPQAADLPPANSSTCSYPHSPQESQTIVNSPTISSSTTADSDSVLQDTGYGTSSVHSTSSAMDCTKDTANSKSEGKPAVKRTKRNARVSNPTPVKRQRITPATPAESIGAKSITLPNGRVKCAECNKTFAKNCYFTQHNKSFHLGEYPYRCQICGKRYQRENVYTVHLQRHGSTDKAHKCSSCPKQFHHKTDLLRHIEGVHKEYKAHCCHICDKDFCRRDHLLKHIETHNRPRAVSRKKAKKAIKKEEDLKESQEIKIVYESEEKHSEEELEQNDSQEFLHENVQQFVEETEQDIARESSPIESDQYGSNIASLDLLVVIRNERDMSELLNDNQNHYNIHNLNELHVNMTPDNEHLLNDDDDNDDEVEMLMQHMN